jgi:O-antigen ligase
VLLSYYGLVTVFDRLLSESGHYELLVETLKTMRHSDLILGQGIGSVPFGSFHRFVLSRVYESGVVGLIFVGFVTAFPFKMVLQKTTSAKSREISGICVGVLFAVVFGLHAYDFFIHLWPWTVMGAMMSFYNSEATLVRAARRLSPVSVAVPVPT